jgi:hypothetical protein
MDDVIDVSLGDDVLDCVQVTDLAADVLDPGELVGAHDQLGPSSILPEVEADHGMTFAHELSAGPGANAAERAGDEPALLRHGGTWGPLRCRPRSWGAQVVRALFA